MREGVCLRKRWYLLLRVGLKRYGWRGESMREGCSEFYRGYVWAIWRGTRGQVPKGTPITSSPLLIEVFQYLMTPFSKHRLIRHHAYLWSQMVDWGWGWNHANCSKTNFSLLMLSCKSKLQHLETPYAEMKINKTKPRHQQKKKWIRCGWMDDFKYQFVYAKQKVKVRELKRKQLNMRRQFLKTSPHLLLLLPGR